MLADIVGAGVAKAEHSICLKSKVFQRPGKDCFPPHSADVFSVEVAAKRLNQLYALKRYVASFLELILQRETLLAQINEIVFQVDSETFFSELKASEAETAQKKDLVTLGNRLV